MRIIEHTDELEVIMSSGELLDVCKAPSYEGKQCVDLHMMIKGKGQRIYRVLANI